MDECANGSHECDHLCINEDGDYRCECEEGYSLGRDGHSCDEDVVGGGDCVPCDGNGIPLHLLKKGEGKKTGRHNLRRGKRRSRRRRNLLFGSSPPTDFNCCPM